MAKSESRKALTLWRIFSMDYWNKLALCMANPGKGKETRASKTSALTASLRLR